MCAGVSLRCRSSLSSLVTVWSTRYDKETGQGLGLACRRNKRLQRIDAWLIHHGERIAQMTQKNSIKRLVTNKKTEMQNRAEE